MRSVKLKRDDDYNIQSAKKNASYCFIIILVKFLLSVVVIFAVRCVQLQPHVVGSPAGRYKYNPLVSAGDWFQNPTNAKIHGYSNPFYKMV